MRNGRSQRLATGIFAVAFPFVAAAQAPARASDPRAVQPERPTVATHAHTVAPGYLEIETGVQRDRIASLQSWSAPTVIKLGLASNLQLNVGVPSYFSSGANSPSGVGDLTLGLKWRFIDNDPFLGDFALLPALTFPSAYTANGTGSGLYSAGVTAISSREVGGVAIDLNATLTRVGVGSSKPYSASLFTASFGFPVTGRLGWVAELYGSPAIDRLGIPTNTSFLTGPTYSVLTELAIDFGIITPLRAGYGHSAYAGLVWNVGRILPLAGSSALSRIPAR